MVTVRTKTLVRVLIDVNWLYQAAKPLYLQHPLRAARADLHLQDTEPATKEEYDLSQATVITMFVQKCHEMTITKFGNQSQFLFAFLHRGKWRKQKVRLSPLSKLWIFRNLFEV